MSSKPSSRSVAAAAAYTAADTTAKVVEYQVVSLDDDTDHKQRRQSQKRLLSILYLTMNKLFSAAAPSYAVNASSGTTTMATSTVRKLQRTNHHVKMKSVKRITTTLGLSLMSLCIICSFHQQSMIRRQQMESTSPSSSVVNNNDKKARMSSLLSELFGPFSSISSFSYDFVGRLSSTMSTSTSTEAEVSSVQNLRRSSLGTTQRPSSSSSSLSSRTFFNRRRLINKNNNRLSYIDERGLKYLALGGQAFIAFNHTVIADDNGDGDHQNNNFINSNQNYYSNGAYPKILSQNVQSVSAIRHPINYFDADADVDDDDDDNPTLASLCTQSMIGDDTIYDVITVQYHTRDSHSVSSVGLLLQRLRQRFPDATIIFVDIWSPYQAYYYDDQHPNEKISFDQWRKSNQQMQMKEMSNDESSLLGKDSRFHDHVWFVNEDDDRQTEIEGLVEDIGGILYRLPRSSVNDNVGQSILDLFVQYQTSVTEEIPLINGGHGRMKYRLSPKAHSFIATNLESIIRRNIEMSQVYRRLSSSSSTAATATNTDVAYFPRVGTWGSGDLCQLWYESGKSMLPTQFSQGLSFVELAASSPSAPLAASLPTKQGRMSSSRGLPSSKPTGSRSSRYALEVTSPSTDLQQDDRVSFANLQIENPFNEDRMVYLTYLTTSATASSRKVYPRTKVQLRHEADQLTATATSGIVVLDPSHDDNSDPHHHTRTSAIGIIPAGQSSTIYFTPLEQNTECGFRIVGTSFLAKEKLTHRISSDFHLSPHGITMKLDDVNDDKEESEEEDAYDAIK